MRSNKINHKILAVVLTLAIVMALFVPMGTALAASNQITATANSGGGQITPSGVTVTTPGGNYTYTMTPDSGGVVTHVWVDASDQGSITTYTFTNITSGKHNIVAAFSPYPQYTLQLVGATTVNLTQTQVEAMVTTNLAPTYTDADGNWTGVALWRLIALVDDSDPSTFNSALASVYSVQLTGADGYVKAIPTSDYGNFTFANNDSVIVANQLNGTQLSFVTSDGKVLYPLKSTGSGCGFSSQKVGGLVKIALLNLPVTTVSVSPASQSVSNGAPFTVNLTINTNQQVRGWQANVDFDAAKMQCTGITEGGFLKDWATTHNGTTMAAPGLIIDNVNGHVTSVGYAILGGSSGGPTGTGTLCTIAFTAKTGINNYANITPSAVVVSDQNGTTIPGVVVNGGTVLIGSEPKPDLVASAKSEAWVSAGANYTISYTITNQGNAPAGACSTSIVIDGGNTTIIIACPALAAGASDNRTTALQTFTGPTDTIVVTADSAGVVAESNEGNNARQNMLSYYGALAGVTVNVTGESYIAHASVVNEVVNPAVSYDPLTFMVNVTNTGLLDDKYELTVSDTLGWTLKLDPSELFVMAADPDHSEYAALSVSVPQDTRGGVSDQITVTATGKMATDHGVVIGPVSSYTIIVTTEIVHSVQVELLPGTIQPQTGAPGSPISWLVVMKNTGNVDDSFTMAVSELLTGVSSQSNHTSWGATFSGQPGTIPAFTKWTSYLKVTIPADAKTSEWDNLNVTLNGYMGSFDSYVVRAHVLEPGPRIPEGVVEITVENQIVSVSCLGMNSYSFGVMVEGQTKNTPTSAPFTVRNTGNVNITISVRGQDALSMPGEPSAKWILSNSADLDQYAMQLNPKTSWYGATDTDLTTGDQMIWSGVPESEEVNYGLTIRTPTAITTPARMWMRITISAVAS